MKSKLWKAACLGSISFIAMSALAHFGLMAAFWCVGCAAWGWDLKGAMKS